MNRQSQSLRVIAHTVASGLSSNSTRRDTPWQRKRLAMADAEWRQWRFGIESPHKPPGSGPLTLTSQQGGRA